MTALTQVAADILGVDVDAIDLQIGDTDLPVASVEGGSSARRSSSVTRWAMPVIGSRRSWATMSA